MKKRRAKPSTLERELRAALTGLPEAPIKAFIHELESCVISHKTLETYPARKRGSRSRQLNQLRRANKRWWKAMVDSDAPLLGSCRRTEHLLRFPHVIEFDMSAEARLGSAEPRHNCRELDDALVGVRTAMTKLNEEIDRALASGRRRGRRRADVNGTLAWIALNFVLCFDRAPSSTPGGAFSNVVTIFLKHAHGGATPCDVSRQVKAALRFSEPSDNFRRM